MDRIEKKSTQKSLLVFTEIESLNKGENLINEYEEFLSLVKSSEVEVLDSLKFKQRTPVTSTFISSGKLESIKDLPMLGKVDLIIINHQFH